MENFMFVAAVAIALLVVVILSKAALVVPQQQAYVVEYLGKHVACQHCHARFEACEPGSADYPPSESGLGLLQRAEELLDTADHLRAHPR